MALKKELQLLRSEVKRMADLIRRSQYEKPLRAEWDYYRKIYRNLSFRDKKLLHEFWYRRFPVQRGFAGDMRFFVKCIDKVMKQTKRKRLRVVEYGGREGSLAFELMKKYPRMSWVNIEIIAHKKLARMKKYEYREHVLSRELWHEKPNLKKKDVFLSCNTLEHISGNQIYALFNYIKTQKIKYLIMRISTSPKGQNWGGYIGSHVLRMGTDTIKGLLRKRGYQLIEELNYEKDVLYLKGWCSFWVLK